MQTTATIQIAASPPDLSPFLWHPDCGDGTYRNPIIYADYSDPDVIRVSENFYLTASSFNCTPGLPILLSKDLVNWRIISYALKNLPHPRYAQVQPGCGVWAPAIRFHSGKFWIFFPMPDEGIYVVTANDPAGKWSKPHLLQGGKGLIDPCPLWDDDGRAYLVHAYAHSRAGMKHILCVRPMAPDSSRLLGQGKIVFHEPEKHPIIEGPKLLKRDGWYYILAPAGGVTNGWQVVLRSRHIYGPYEDKIVLAQGGTSINGPHQGALVDAPNGDWWFIHFQDVGIYGRVTHLQPVRWQHQWPLMGTQNENGVGEPVLHHAKPVESGPLLVPQTSDEFNLPPLGLQWQWHANHKKAWYSLGRRKGWLRLYPQFVAGEKLPVLPNLLLQKFPARSFSAETLFHFVPKQCGEEAGLIVAGKSSAALAVEKTGTGHRLVLRVNGEQRFVQENVPAMIKLRASVENGGMCSFSFATFNSFVSIPEPFQAENGVWIGAKVGLYSLSRKRTGPGGHVDVDYFRFSSLPC
jgi:beta-xylosidase